MGNVLHCGVSLAFDLPEIKVDQRGFVKPQLYNVLKIITKAPNC